MENETNHKTENRGSKMIDLNNMTRSYYFKLKQHN